MATKVDPAQREKEEIRSWLVDCIDKLYLQIDQFESESETLHAGKKKKVDRDVSAVSSLKNVLLALIMTLLDKVFL